MGVKVNYTLIGLFVIVLGCGLIYGVYWFSMERESRPYHFYTLYLNESVAGLPEQAPVKFNGVDVGYVQSIQLNQQNLQQVRLHLKIVEGTPITEDTYAMIMSRGITGVAYIGLSSESPAGRPLTTLPGEVYPVIKSRPSLLVELDRALSEVTLNIKLVAQGFQQVMDDENRAALKSILQNIDAFSAMLAERSYTIERTINMAEQVFTNVSHGTKQLPEIMNQLQETLQNFQAMSKQISNSASQFNVTMQDSRTMIKNMNAAVLPTAYNVMEKLEEMLNTLNQVIIDLEQNPSVLVRGKKLNHKGPG